MRNRFWTRISTTSLVSVIVYAEAQSTAKPDPSLLWGPYRPNVYFGIRPQIPESLLMGLMWAKTENDGFAAQDLRHSCQHSEGIDGYWWENYEPRTGGSQIIHDITNYIDIRTDFFKSMNEDAGQRWGARVSGTPRPDAPKDLEWLLVFYLGTEAQDSDADSFLLCSETRDADSVGCYGNQSQLQDFSLQIRGLRNHAGKVQPGHTVSIRSDEVPGNGIWQAESIFESHVHSGTTQSGDGTLYFVQKGFRGQFQFEIVFSSNQSIDHLTSKELSKGIKKTTSRFKDLFKSVYGPTPPFDSSKYLSFSQELFANLLSGLGYFYGDSMADLSQPEEYKEKDTDFWEKIEPLRSKAEPEIVAPRELFSMVSSRAFFPRGCLWGEGFHLLVVIQWDLDLAMDIVESWLGLMDEDGWIAREQVLGSEARSIVPPQSRVQYPQHANPPTLFLVVSEFVEIFSGNKTYAGHSSRYLKQPQLATDFLRSIYPLLQRHYTWFRKTQAGDLQTYTRPNHTEGEAYRWRGRIPGHTATSGLDDHPRAEPPHPGELHVDAISWVGLMAKVLKELASILGENEDELLFSRHGSAIEHNLETLHWSDEHQVYCDATIDNSAHSLVCHKGYVSLFPFMLGLLEPSHRHFKALFDLIKDENEVWSRFGVRSLSKQDEHYSIKAKYWRGSVWININFLILEQLLKLALSQSPYQLQARETYSSLRKNLVSTVYESWHDTGQVWEYFDADSGAGHGAVHFTGWTALIVKIAAMPDLEHTGILTLGGLTDRSTYDRRLVLSTATLVVFVLIFRRNLARLWTSLFR